MKPLVTYFSASNNTRILANTLSEALSCDLFEIEPQKTYTPKDLNWNDPHSRSSLEMRDPDSVVEIANRVENIDEYDVLFVGFPIWWYQAPRIIESFLKSYDLSNKTIICFATSGGSGLGKTEDVLKSCCANQTKWKKGKLFNPYTSVAKLREWINTLEV